MVVTLNHTRRCTCTAWSVPGASERAAILAVGYSTGSIGLYGSEGESLTAKRYDTYVHTHVRAMNSDSVTSNGLSYQRLYQSQQ